MTYYRCRYPREYALAAHVEHPVNVYLREADVLPPLDGWLTTVFAPHRLEGTVRALVVAQPSPEPASTLAEDAAARIADCDTRLARYQAALDAGADPVTVASWTRKVQAERAAVLAQARRPSSKELQLTESDIQQIIGTLGSLAAVIRDADPAAKAKVYAGLNLRLTYQPGQQLVRAEAQLAPQDFGAMGRVRGGVLLQDIGMGCLGTYA